METFTYGSTRASGCNSPGPLTRPEAEVPTPGFPHRSTYPCNDWIRPVLTAKRTTPSVHPNDDLNRLIIDESQ